MLRITIVAGARPNFMKIAPIIHAIINKNNLGVKCTYRLVHTGQHYDKNMSGDFFEQLNIPDPHANLASGGGTQAEQTASIMIAFEKELLTHRPNIVLVVGDVTSTMACAITAKKLQIQVVHVEAGIRSGDILMPEEINRLVTDSITDHFFTTSETANKNLGKLGIEKERIHWVGNTMIDTLIKHKSNFRKPKGWQFNDLKEQKYFVLTIHRPSNVDNDEQLRKILEAIIAGTEKSVIIFPIHPRTSKRIVSLGFNSPNLRIVQPLGYLEFNFLVKNAKGIITDSGGITEEASVLNVPCITLRDSTERPETVSLGTNELIGTNPNKIKPYLKKINAGKWKQYKGIPLWDGKSAERIIDKITELYFQEPS